MNILILGGTGSIGSHLIEILSARASHIVVSSRQARESLGNIHYVQGDAKDWAFLQPLLENHWDAIIDFMIYSTEDFKNRQNALLSSTNQYFFLSSARVYANSNKPLTEMSPRLLDVSTDADYLLTDEYALAKARQENCLFECGRRNWTIIRPYITYSMERLQLGVLEKEAWLYRALQGRQIVFSEYMTKRKTTMTHGRNVAQAMAVLTGNSAALGEVFHITETKCRAWSSVLELYVKAIAKTGKKAQVKLVELDQFASCHSGKYQILYDRHYDRVFDNKKINEFIDTSTFISAEEGLKLSINKFLEAPKFLEINWCYEGVKDKFSREFSRLGKIKKFKNKLRYLKYRLT